MRTICSHCCLKWRKLLIDGIIVLPRYGYGNIGMELIFDTGIADGAVNGEPQLFKLKST